MSNPMFAAARLSAGIIMTDPGAIILDDRREQRLGFDETILCSQKTPEQITSIVEMSQAAGCRRFFTRLEDQKFAQLAAKLQRILDYDPLSRTAVLGGKNKVKHPTRTAIVSAGSSDAPVVAETRKTLLYYGHDCLLVSDAGVAGIWRLMERIDDIKIMPVVIAVAGMDAALPSVLCGLIPASIIGVPTSTGYGMARDGETALSAMLCSCAPGLTVVNIDNGYGAACAALRLLNLLPDHTRKYPGEKL